MRTQLNKIILVAGIMLAITFTLSCSSVDDNGGTGTSSSSVGESSSSSEGSSSSIASGSSSSSELAVSSSSSKENSSSSILEDTSSSSEISSSSAYSSSSIEQSSSSIAECNGEEYNEINEFCFEDTIYEKCSNKIYNPAKQKCDENTVQNHCNDALYDTYLEYCVDGVLKDKEEFIDDRDQKTYKTVDIGSQTWMAENLNYNANDSYCYNDDPNNCADYGRLYNWAAAMESCPSGWHLPSRAEWEQLIDYIGGKEAVETKLKANSSLWRYNTDANSDTDRYNIGTDNYGFSALPGGYAGIAYGFDGKVSPEYWYKGRDVRWWSSTEHLTYKAEAYNLRIGSVLYTGINYEKKNYWFSIRCVKD
jgi:uncharacterized protein (TIGR02145 family)